MRIELNDQFKRALDSIERTRAHIFITGKAGTGKSTLLTYFRAHTAKKIVVLAPTGVAALNVAGETIHSFFGFKPTITAETIKTIKGKRARVFKKLDTIVIDEISMVRADVLDCVDIFLRRNGPDKKSPFGGIQMVFIGDLYQLPPVVTAQEKIIFTSRYPGPYFFYADVLKDVSMEFLELEKIYRQKDAAFISLLNAIRNNSAGPEELAVLNSRVNAKLDIPADTQDFTVHLTTTNEAARRINEERLTLLSSRVHTYTAELSGDFSRHSCPTEEHLQLAEGSQVMLLNNDSMGRWVNGTLGKIVRIAPNERAGCDGIMIELPGGIIEEVLPFRWELFHFGWDARARAITSETTGSFTQYPLRLAWAVTIHKSQGKTFERVIIDMGAYAFAGGQTYVALSRCTSFEGISLRVPIKKHHVYTDRRIVEFVTQYQYRVSEQAMPLKEKIRCIEDAIAGRACLQITYLKNNDQKTRRVIIPREVGEMEYAEKTFIGVSAYCCQRKEERMFRVDRILEMSTVEFAPEVRHPHKKLRIQ